MFDAIRGFFANFFNTRTYVMTLLMVAFAAILIGRLFTLQIVNGEDYQTNYNLTIEKTETTEAARGCIYDRNGNLLAYNELSYAITIEDSGSYSSTKVKNASMNEEIYQIIIHLEAYGDSIDNEFPIVQATDGSYSFMYAEGTTKLNRFKADVYSQSSYSDLTEEQANATAQEIMDYLMGSSKFNITSDSYSEEYRYKICVVRYYISQNNYQKYVATTIASDVSEESVAYISENINELEGVAVVEQSMRVYVDSEYFAHIIGYTGTISTDEYYTRLEEGEDVEITDVVGKSGIEQYMDEYLSGTKGTTTFYVDSAGSVTEITDSTDAVPGNDVYLSIDKDLQIATYNALEKEIATIVYSKLEDAKESTGGSSDITIPIYDVYYSFLDNGLIDRDAFALTTASETEAIVLAAYEERLSLTMDLMRELLYDTDPEVYSDLTDEYQDYSTYIVTSLKSLGIFDASLIDSSDEYYQLWITESLSVTDYLRHAIEMDWIDYTQYASDNKYSDTDELYEQLIEYILNYLETNDGFELLVYKYLLLDDGISGTQLCVILYEQGILEEDGYKEQLLSGQISSYEFVRSAIQSGTITPGQLGLDPCSGSAVIIDSDTGELLACVTYPGYDNNKLANTVDSSYYVYLNTTSSTPLYNYATQQKTAPGSTFKIVTSVAALAEGIIDVDTEVEDLGMFELVDNTPKCWAYPSNHGYVNVTKALKVSCNYFFYQMGFDLAGGETAYNDSAGISLIQYYASLFGLDSKTGIEIEESTSTIATEYPVMAAIGQSDNNYTTIALARYVTAVSNQGTVYNLTLLDHVENSETGELIASYTPTVKNEIDVLTQDQWDAIAEGLREVVENSSAFDSLEVEAAGKTGTAQQVSNRANHALFVGYAPYDDPDIAIAVRIAYGYSSSNATVVASNIFAYYFGEMTLDDILNIDVTGTTTTNSFTD